MKTKGDFIIDLLSSKKLSIYNRERILKLTAKEYGKNSEELKNLKAIIEKMNYDKNPPLEPSKNGLPKYIDPIKLYNALLAYNQNPILKTTCHPMSIENIENIVKNSNLEEYNFNKHLELIKINFNELSNKQSFTKNMFSLIYNYLNGDASWSSQKILISWRSEELIEWTISYPNFVPNPEDSLIEALGNEGYILANPFVSLYTNKTIENFNDLVLFFKSLWHIKYDNPLQKILEIRNTNKKYYEWADIRFINFSQTLNLFTDVSSLVDAYSKTIDLIKENRNEKRPEIIISLLEKDSEKILSIHQKDTFWKKSISDTMETPFGNSMTDLINKQINGLCDLHIRARFEDNKSYKLNLWDDKKREKEIIPMIDGVEYLLILKK